MHRGLKIWPKNSVGGNLKTFLCIIPEIASLCPTKESILFWVQDNRFGLTFQKDMFLDLISFAQESNSWFLPASYVKEVFCPHNRYISKLNLGDRKFDSVFGAPNDHGKHLSIDWCCWNISKEGCILRSGKPEAHKNILYMNLSRRLEHTDLLHLLLLSPLCTVLD